MAASTRDLQPKVEDYHSDDSDAEGRGQGVPLESARRSPAASANVAAKRASNDTAKQEAERVNNIDLQSDSGYSSHTAATMSSADSGPSARSPPTATAAPVSPPSPPTPQPRRPTVSSSDRKHSNSNSQSSPRKPLQRASSRRPPTNRRLTVTTNEDCDDPNCTTCGPSVPSTRSRPSQPSRDSALDVSYPPDVRSQRSDPAPSTYTSPRSPTYYRQPAPYTQGPAVVQPSGPRRRSSSTSRPMSFNGDPGQYWVPGMPVPYPGAPQEHGPPPTFARYQSQIQHSAMPPHYMMPTNGYYPPGQSQPSPYDYPARPPMPARNSSNNPYQARGPLPAYGPGVPQPGAEPMHSARYPNALPGPKDALLLRDQEEEEEDDDDDDDEEESSGYSDSDEDQEPPRSRTIMAPPPAIKNAHRERRPSLRHANTTQALPERTKERESRDPRLHRTKTTTGHSRAPSSHRPKVIQEPSKVRPNEPQRAAAQSKVFVENSRRRQSYQSSGKVYERVYEVEPKPKPRRRESIFYDDEFGAELDRKQSNRTSNIYHDDRGEYYDMEQKRSNRTSRVLYDERDDYEAELERKRRNRNSKVVRDDRDEYQEIDHRRRNRDSKMYNDENHDAIVIPERTRRRTVTSSNARPEYIAEKRDHRTADAEAYQQRMRGMDAPLNDAVHKAALKKSTRTPSDSASNRSDDKKSRVSRAPTTVTNSGGEIRLRVDASAPLNLSFNGNMEGHTLHFEPAEGGMADIVIGNSETVYRSERGSMIGPRKAITGPSNPRRAAEESSERSSRSGASRRQVDRESRRGDDRPPTVYRRTKTHLY